jgi:superfamily I DNA and/or RNA helicase
MKVDKTMSVGIITFYARQRSLIVRKLEQLQIPKTAGIEVKTVDAFQVH